MKKLILLSLVTLFSLNTSTFTLYARDNDHKHMRELKREERKLRRKAERKAAENEKMIKTEHKRELRREAKIKKDATQNTVSSVSNSNN
jgi:hypothetical protein